MPQPDSHDTNPTAVPTPTANASPSLAEQRSPREWTVALIGNPNTGKSTLFNGLAGMNAHVGNYPGVTVEKKLGHFRLDEDRVTLVDLPGTYSLSPRSEDEMLPVRVLLGQQQDIPPIDAVICIVDATHLQRNLYLFSQLRDLGLPTLLVLNMWDEVERRGIELDVPELQQRLGVPVIPLSARKRKTYEPLRQELKQLLLADTESKPQQARLELFPEAFQQARRELAAEISANTGNPFPEYLAERLLLDVHGETEREVFNQHQLPPGELQAKREALSTQGCPIPAIEPRVRHQWIRETLQGVLQIPEQSPITWQDRVDNVLTHRAAGPLIFALVMFLVFQAIYPWAEPLMEWIEERQEDASGLLIGVMGPGPLRSLLMDGVIRGVGSVLVFLPQIAILFLFIALLEDCGYMARAAYTMDRLMTRFGLSGKSFVPLMSSYACAIPGIMATRTIEDRKDRLATILVAPLMSCSARLPVYLLMINAFIPDDSFGGDWFTLRGLVLFLFYFVGALVAIPVAWTLKRTWLKGEPAPFVMELPGFKWPALRVVFTRVKDRSKDFLINAGTLIFVTTILVWAAGYFPGDHSELNALTRDSERSSAKLESLEEQLAAAADHETPEEQEFRQLEIDALAEEVEQLQDRRRELATQLLNASFLGQAGRMIEPVVKPLGWDWRIGMAVISSFPAREVVIGTLGTIFSLGDIEDDDPRLLERLQAAERPDGSPLFNIPVALSVMVFFALCAQCAATLVVMRQETRSWKWPLFSFVYMTTLAYIAALIVYQTGMWIGMG